MLEKAEVRAMLQIIGRSDFKGEEVMGVAGLIQKLQGMRGEEENPAKDAQTKSK